MNGNAGTRAAQAAGAPARAPRHPADGHAARVRPWVRGAAWAVVAGILAMTFLAYQSPHLAVDLANRLWSCF